MAEIHLHMRLISGTRVALGPGKAELLVRIGETGSIAAAGRAMGMSYKRAWQLVEVMNATFREPLVDSARGGAGGGGAQLTKAGAAALAHYQALVAATADSEHVAELQTMLRVIPDQE